LKEEYPELIVIDINMPKMDGFEFLEELKKLEIENKHSMRVIMLSIFYSPREIERLKDLRVELIRKPLSEEKIQELLRESHACHG
jgi:CheY-like chemotaxis protein